MGAINTYEKRVSEINKALELHKKRVQALTEERDRLLKELNPDEEELKEILNGDDSE